MVRIEMVKNVEEIITIRKVSNIEASLTAL